MKVVPEHIMELKKNKTPFILMKNQLRAEAREIGRENFWIKDEFIESWQKCLAGEFDSMGTYRLDLNYYRASAFERPSKDDTCPHCGNPMPNTVLAEMAVVGAMILDNDCIPFVLNACRNPIFRNKRNQLVYDPVVHLYYVRKAIFNKRYPEIDLVAIREELKGRGQIEDIGGVEYLIELAEAVPSSANIEQYVLASQINKLSEVK